ncbi:MAG TPA: RNA polymerase factor sigma-54 [Armatimonadota bacterium]|nr:RNA polymerase factor sigma-54 [Armatimonadota bacterium]
MLIQDQSQVQQQRIDPKLIMANTLLQMSGMEIQQTIEQELAQNPALELEEEQPCANCELAPFMCEQCPHNTQVRPETPSPDEISLHDLQYIFDSAPDPDEQGDPFSRIQAEVSLQEHLREQLRNTVSGKLCEIADYLINYINESGYLECDLLEVTLELDASDEDLAEAVSIIQTFEPPGVGARDLRECMEIQLRYLADEGRGNPIAERILSDFWEEMKTRRFNRIARRLKVKPELVQEAVEFIRTKLSPYPAAGFRSPWDYRTSDSKTVIRPDVVIHRLPTGYEVEIVGNEFLSLAVNPYYRELYNDVRSNRAKHPENEKKHVLEYVERADLFIKNLNQRRKTLKSIAKCIAEYQQGYLDTGSKLYLRPFTRVKVAEMLGLHESTVSRATANKYVQLPNQEVMPFEFFFQSSPSIADMVVQMIAGEDPTHPLSDQDISNILTQQGHRVARRTVVKYRESQKILSSRQRRR